MRNIFYIFFLLSLAQVSHASFLPENNLRIEKSKTLDSDEEIKQRFMPLATTIASLYQEQIAAQQATLQIKFDLKSSKVNAYATRKGPDQKLWQVVFLGGMLRHKNISNNIFISIMCHELGHHLSGGPFKKSSWVSVEGQADYFTTQNCLKKVLQHTNLIEISNQTHRFEPINTVPRAKQVIAGPNNLPILNLPWASLFCIYLLPKLKSIRPFIDKVRPLSLYVKWTIIHDFRFFLYLSWTVIAYCIRTQFRPYGRYNKNFKISLRQVFKIAVHPKYEKNAKRVFATRPDVKVVVMGHTHITEWRRFKDGKLYFNTGTWNQVPSVDAGMHKNISNLTYVCIELNEKRNTIKNAFLNVWQGKWRPFREEVSTTFFPNS